MGTFVFSLYKISSLTYIWIKISWGSAEKPCFDLTILVYNEIKVAVMVSPQAATKPYTTTPPKCRWGRVLEGWK